MEVLHPSPVRDRTGFEPGLILDQFIFHAGLSRLSEDYQRFERLLLSPFFSSFLTGTGDWMGEGAGAGT